MNQHPSPHECKDLRKDCTILNQDEESIIGNNVWIACQATILKGAHIPFDSVLELKSYSRTYTLLIASIQSDKSKVIYIGKDDFIHTI